VPAVHVTLADGRALKERLAGDQRVRIALGAAHVRPVGGDVLARFSSRGPQMAVPDIPKPDLTAPGVDILAADSPAPAIDKRPGESFQVLSGTSMAAPHVAGAAALLMQLHPRWSPAAVKSALMTTAVPKLAGDDAGLLTSPFDIGSGRIDPNRAAAPGLVLDVSTNDYLRYLEGITPERVVGDPAPLAPADLNLPAVSFSALAGSAFTRRTFTNVDGRRGVWRVAVEGLDGIETRAMPASFDIGPGGSQAVEVTVARRTAAFDRYSFGAMILTHEGDGRRIRLPLSVRPVRVAVPRIVEVVTERNGGSTAIPLRAGYAGDLAGLGHGLAVPQLQRGETVAAGRGAPPFSPSPGVRTFDFDVPSGSFVVGAELSSVDDGDPDTDLDLYLFHDDEGDGFDEGDLVALSAASDSAESVAVPHPAAVTLVRVRRGPAPPGAPTPRQGPARHGKEGAARR
jgi:hypothetical protein